MKIKPIKKEIMPPLPRYWQETNIRYIVKNVKTGGYFARKKIYGKLVFKTLRTKILSTAKKRLPSVIKGMVAKRESNYISKTSGLLTMGHALDKYQRLYEDSYALSSSTKRDRDQGVLRLIATWPRFREIPINIVKLEDCENWLKRFSEYGTKNKRPSQSTVRKALEALKRTLDLAVKYDAIKSNPASGLNVGAEEKKVFNIPEKEEFRRLIIELETKDSMKFGSKGGYGGHGIAASELIQGIAYSGMLISEAAELRLADVLFEEDRIHIFRRIKNGSQQDHSVANNSRYVPMSEKFRRLAVKILERRKLVKGDAFFFQVKACYGSLKSACNNIGIVPITHQNLRDLFVMDCLKSGIPLPLVALWLGHKSNGVYLIKRYGDLLMQMSEEENHKYV